MRTLGLKTLKNKLSEYVRDVAAGEVVLVTDRGRVVAKLVHRRTGRHIAPTNAMQRLCAPA